MATSEEWEVVTRDNFKDIQIGHSIQDRRAGGRYIYVVKRSTILSSGENIDLADGTTALVKGIKLECEGTDEQGKKISKNYIVEVSTNTFCYTVGHNATRGKWPCVYNTYEKFTFGFWHIYKHKQKPEAKPQSKGGKRKTQKRKKRSKKRKTNRKRI